MQTRHFRPLAALLPMALVAREASAYLDPNSGTMLIQIVIAGAVGSALFFKTSWMRVRALFSRVTGADKGTPTLQDSGNDTPVVLMIFDELGSPIAEAGDSTPGLGGTITISGSGSVFTILVDAYTGRVTVSREDAEE